MVKAGDKVTYHQSVGEIISVIDDNTAMVKLQDGQEYMLPIDSLVIEKSIDKAAMKKPEYLSKLAKDLKEAGIEEINIRNGEITNFKVNLTLEEKIISAQEAEKARHQSELKKIEEEIRRKHEGEV